MMGGAVVIFSFQYLIVGDPRPMADWVVDHGFASIVFFAAGSYLVGTCVKEFLSGWPIRLCITDLAKSPRCCFRPLRGAEHECAKSARFEELVATNEAVGLLQHRTIRLMERSIFLEHLGASVGSCFGVSCIALAVAVARRGLTCRCEWLIPVGAFLAAFWGVCYNRHNNKAHRKFYCELKRYITDKVATKGGQSEGQPPSE